MTSRHTATVKFLQQDLIDWRLVEPLGLRGHRDLSGQPLDRFAGGNELSMSRPMVRARNQLKREFMKAFMISTDCLIVDLEAQSCDALVALMVEARVDREFCLAQSGGLDRAIRYVQSAREHLIRTEEAWLGTDEMPLETIYFTDFEQGEVWHWMSIYEAENDNGRRDFLSPAERLIDIRLHDQWGRDPNLGSFTGDLETFLALGAIMEEASQVAQDFGYAAERKHEILKGKLDDVIESLTKLEQDAVEYRPHYISA